MPKKNAAPYAQLAAVGGADLVIDAAQAEAILADALAKVPGPLKRVLLIPPDFTRFHSGAGELTCFVDRHLAGVQVDILPALGTHAPMSAEQIERMFPGIEPSRILVHDWRDGLVRLGEVPAEFVAEVSGGLVDYPIEIALDRLVVEGGYDLILSLGQVVPHEVIGMANQSKNLFVGVGGRDIINRSHFLGAAFGLERIMGRADTPVRRVFDYAAEQFTRHLPLCYVLTVRAMTDDGLVTRGLFVGDDAETFRAAAALSAEVNITQLVEPVRRCVVWLDPDEYHSTWLGNKAVYRTRLALADGAELLILAPGVRSFGEDPLIDALIRRHGYRRTPSTLAAVKADRAMADNLSAAAHLIHGSSEGRFTVTYAAGGLSRAEIESVGYRWADLDRALRAWPPDQLRDGWNALRSGPIYFVRNPALGLWARRGALGE